MDLQDKSENHLSCPHCPFKVEKEELLAFTRHLSRHLCGVEIVCSLCNHVCSDLGDVQAHLESHFPFLSKSSPSPSQSLDSSSCTAVLETKHVASLHLDQNQRKETEGNHKKKTVNDLVYETTRGMERKFCRKMPSTVTQYKCQFCTFQTEEFSKISNHEKNHHRSNLIHMTDKERQLIPCQFENCHYKAKFLSQLKNHMITHTKERPFSCPHCDHTCNHKSNLQRHIWIHQRETMLLAQF